MENEKGKFKVTIIDEKKGEVLLDETCDLLFATYHKSDETDTVVGEMSIVRTTNSVILHSVLGLIRMTNGQKEDFLKSAPDELRIPLAKLFIALSKNGDCENIEIVEKV